MVACRSVGSTGVSGVVQLHQAQPLVERWHALIEQLRVRHPRVTSGPELARRLGVSVRTIERDITQLTAAGVPIEIIRGPHGGYRLGPTVRASTIEFTAGEIAALIASLTAIGPYSSAVAHSAHSKLLAALTDNGPQGPRGRAGLGGDPEARA